MSTYLTDEENLAELIAAMPEHEQAPFSEMGASRIEAAFKGRVLVLYKPNGLTKEGQHREPVVLTTVEFVDFLCDSSDGADFTIRDVRAGETMTIGHQPTRLFDYNVFLHIPLTYRMRYDARRVDGGVQRSLVFPVSVYTRNRSSNYSAGVHYAETPNRFREMYPKVSLNLKHD